MKKIGVILFLSIIAVCLNSCENEIYETDGTNQKSSQAVTIKDGRMFFESKEALATVYQQYADATDEKLSEFLLPKYEAGFYSLRPIVTESNEQFIYDHYNKLRNTDLSKKTASREEEEDPYEYLDDLEDIIGDDAFAAFLNNQAEIRVGDEIFKYTDVGLFFSKQEKYNILQDYLAGKNISTDPTVPTSDLVKREVENDFPQSGATDVNEDITFFRVPPAHCEDCGSGGGAPGGGGYVPHPSSPVSTDPSFNSFLGNLQSCDPHPGIFGNLFGDNDVCIDKYESRRRVKTKAFNYNYFVVYHLGVKCVHQYKGWTGFWRVEATDEVRLVVEAAQFQYDLNQLTGNTAINNNTPVKDFYLNDQKITYAPNSINIGGPYGFTYSNLNHSALPSVFQNEGSGLTFEFFGTGLPFLDNLIQNGIDSNLNAQKLNDHFYNFLYSETKSILQNALSNTTYTPPANRTFVAKFPENGKLIVQKAVVNKGLNCGVRQKTFDWGAEFRFNASQGGDGSWSISGGQGSIMTRPTGFRVKIIGAAKHGTAWHGSKFSDGID
ncbi:hypothetical protein [Flavobacterium sp.]|uniref:hypothetical protein n=1 Tax=Flavobacterium sp. TaxID=239 RepID=UPI003D6BBF3B